MSGSPFRFFLAGGCEQVHFATGADLLRLDELDRKLWVALACPTKGLAFDARTLELLDADGDGRIRASELADTARWLGGLLQTPDLLLTAPSELPLTAIDAGTAAGRALLDAAKAMLRSLGKDGASVLSVADAEAASKAFDALPFNGDGVVTPEAAAAPELRAVLEDVLAVTSGTVDRSGRRGVTWEQLSSCVDAAVAHEGWLAKAQEPGVLPLGSATSAAHQALTAVRNKVDDYFTRCRLAAFDPRATAALNRDEQTYAALATGELSASEPKLKALPLALVQPGAPLALDGGLNPAWTQAMGDVRTLVIRPLLGETATLSEAAWADVTGRFGAYERWLASKAGAAVEARGPERIHALASGSTRALAEALFEEERAQAPTAAALRDVEKLVRCVRDFHRLATNFVSFREFYSGARAAIFQVGTLYLDRRACELCLSVEDAARHAALGPRTNAALAYCACVRPATHQQRTIVAVLTAGDGENLMAGRNGVFVDRDGHEWDATITHLVTNPISVGEAFWAPYKKLARLLEEQVTRRMSEANARSTERLSGTATALDKAAQTGKPGEPPARFDVGVVAALGVAVGGLAAAFGALVQAFFGLGPWMPLGLLGALLLISGPSMALAWLKLRRRNLGPLLDANGWAINANAVLSVPFGASLTHVAVRPAGSQLDRRDPYAPRGGRWAWLLAALLLTALVSAYVAGALDRILPEAVRRSALPPSK